MSRLDILICKVQSKKLYHTKRFVPKKSLDLNDPYVELKLVKFTQDAQIKYLVAIFISKQENIFILYF